MAISKGRNNDFLTRSSNSDFGFLLDTITGQQTNLKYSNLSGQYRDVFNKNELGEYVFVPFVDFTGYVEMWGAGGGAHSHSTTYTTAFGGGGGYTRGMIKFKKDIPYCFIVGQGGIRAYADTTGGNGEFRNAKGWGSAIGGGGQGYAGGGSGGGLTGIFYKSLGNIEYGVAGGNSRGKSEHGGKVETFYISAPQQANALMIAGGGGGGGHPSYGQGGGGGGTTSQIGHNTGQASQTVGGTGGYGGATGINMLGGESGTGSSHCGGGGGGYWGGGGGGHTTSHHNGGSGGSGHAVDLFTTGANAALLPFVSGSYTETAPGGYNFQSQGPQCAQRTNPRRTGYAGMGGGWNEYSNPAGGTPYVTGSSGQLIVSLAQGWS
jgi:hypothetical protein